MNRAFQQGQKQGFVESNAHERIGPATPRIVVYVLWGDAIGPWTDLEYNYNIGVLNQRIAEHGGVDTVRLGLSRLGSDYPSTPITDTIGPSGSVVPDYIRYDDSVSISSAAYRAHLDEFFWDTVIDDLVPSQDITQLWTIFHIWTRFRFIWEAWWTDLIEYWRKTYPSVPHYGFTDFNLWPSSFWSVIT